VPQSTIDACRFVMNHGDDSETWELGSTPTLNMPRRCLPALRRLRDGDRR
jgi:hypothetical protein